MPRKNTSETLPEEIARLRTEEVLKVVSAVYEDREGIYPLPEPLKTGKNALVYDLCMLILGQQKQIHELEEKLRGRKAQKQKQLEVLSCTVFPFIEPEIDELFMAIRKVGTKDYVPVKWKEAVLSRFDDSKKGFKSIIREDLEDDNLYSLRSDHEKKDFRAKLLQKVLRRNLLGSYGIGLILEARKKNKPA